MDCSLVRGVSHGALTLELTHLGGHTYLKIEWKYQQEKKRLVKAV